MSESIIYIQPEEKQWTAEVSIENQNYQEQEICESEISEQIEQAPIHAELRPPEHHDRSLSPATKLRTQDLSYAEILALGLRKQAKTQNIVSLPEPQVAQVEMVKEIIVEVEKAPPVIEYEPRVQSTESLRVKTDKFERPAQRSRSRDMPRQRRAPEKRSTKSHDTQIIKKKKLSKRVIEVEDFDDTPEQQDSSRLDSLPLDSNIQTSIQTIDKLSTETSCKELVKKVQHSATVVETVTVESILDLTKSENDQKKAKKKNKHKKPKDADDEIEKALKEIEESDKQKKRKTKDSRDKSKEKMTKGTESDEAIDKNDGKMKQLASKLDNKEITIKQKKKKIVTKELQTSEITEPSSVAQQKSIKKTITENVNVEIERGNSSKDDDSGGSSWESNLEDLSANVLKYPEASDDTNQTIMEESKCYEHDQVNKSTNLQDEDKQEVIQHLIRNVEESNVNTETLSLTKDSSVKNINLSTEPELEIASKQKKKKKNKKQGKAVEEINVDQTIIAAVDKTVEENVQPIGTTAQEISHVQKKAEKSKKSNKTDEKANVTDVTLAQVNILDVTDTSKKPKSKKQKSIEIKDSSTQQTISNPLSTNAEEKTRFETSGEVESTDAKTHKKKSKSKKPKIVDDEIEQALREIDQTISAKKKTIEKYEKIKDKHRETRQEAVKTESFKIMRETDSLKVEDSNIISGDQEVKSTLVTMDWNTLMAEEEDIPESELAPITQPSIETDLSLESEQIATEVTILPEIIDATNIEAEIKECLEKEISETTQSIIDPDSNSNEQNNNKTLRTDNLIDSSFNIVEEITRYEPIIQDMETRTIYLITHEEKKLPPIRTVKVFNSKINSSSIDSQDENVTEIKTATVTSQENNENILGEPLISSDLITESLSEDLKSVVDNQHTDVVIEEQSLNTKTESVPKLDSEEARDKDITYLADNDYKEIIVDDKNQSNVEEYQCSNVEEFSENILEHAIFGSVQDRQRGQLNTSTIPYQELEEIKTYSINLDIDRLDFDYYQLLDKQSNSSSKCEPEYENTQIAEQDQADGEIVQKAAVSLSFSDITEHSGFKEAQLKCDEVKSVDNSFTSIPEKSEDIYPEGENSNDVKSVLDNEATVTTSSQDTLKKTDFKNRAETNVIQIPPTTYLEIVLDTQSIQTATSSLENNQKCTDVTSTLEVDNNGIIPNKLEIIEFNKENDVLKSKDIMNIEAVDTTGVLFVLENEIPRFDYREITDAEKFLGIICPKETMPVPKPSVTNEDVKQPEVHETSILEKVTNESNILIETVPKEILPEFTKSHDSEENSIYLSMKRFNEEFSFHCIYHCIADAEKIYPRLVNLYEQEQQNGSSCDVNIDTIENTQVLTDIDTVEESKTVAEADIINITKNPSDTNDEGNTTLVSENLLENKPNEIDVIHFEKPKYDYHELSKSEILLASILSRENNKNDRSMDESHHNQINISTDEKLSVPLENGNKNEEIHSQDLNPVDNKETTVNKTFVQDYHVIHDAENRYALNLSESTVDTEPASLVKDTLELIQISESEEVRTQTLPQNLNDNSLQPNSEESHKEEESKSQSVAKVPKKTPNIHSPEPQTVFYEPIIYNYSDLKEAEHVFAQNIACMLSNNENTIDSVINTDTIENPPEKSDAICVTNKFDGKDDNDLNNEEKAEVFTDVDSRKNEQTTTVEIQDFNTLVPAVFGDVAMVATSILEREAKKKQEEARKQEVNEQNVECTVQNQIEQVESPIKENIEEDFVVVENLHLNLPELEISVEKAEDSGQESNPNLGDELDFEHSFEVIDLEKDVSFELQEPTEINSNFEKVLTVEPPTPAAGISPSSIDNVDVSSSTELLSEFKKDEVHHTEGISEISKCEFVPQTISAKFIEAEIVHSVCSPTLSTDTQQQVSNVMSTEPDVLIDKSIGHEIDSKQSTRSKTETSSRPEKSPIHNLHDLLPEIDSIPEFKPSFSTTVLNSKLSADAPEFTPSYLYKTFDLTISDCKQVNTQISNIDERVSLQTDLHKTNATPITYSSILSSKKEQEIPDINIKQKESEMLYDVKRSEESTEDKLEPKSKRNKKQKQKDNKKEVTAIKDETSTIVTSVDEVSSVPIHEEQKQKSDSDQKENIWTKLSDDGKSYAEVLAEGLVVQEISPIHVVENQEVQSTTESILEEKTESPVTEALRCVEYDNQESHDSWAKIVASNRPSPEKIQKLTSPNEPIQSKSKTPIILVDESDSEHNKPDLEVDAEGFIKVDRNRRSRSKSRDNRSSSANRTMRQTDVREKSENRFNALTSTLKPDDGETVQSSHSDEEKEPIKKGRKSRSTKSKEKEVKTKVAQIAPSTSDEEKQPVKKDKKKRSSKSKEKVNKPLDVSENSETLQEIIEVEPIDVQQKEDLSVQGPQVSTLEIKKKSKKKKKEKKVIVDTTDTPSPVDITSSEVESSEPTYTVPLKSVETPISTPESIETPIKDRFYAEAQYWKVDPSAVDDLTSISEILTVKIDYADNNKQENIVIEVQQAPESANVETTKINNEKLEGEVISKEMDTEALSPLDLPKTIESQRISDEQSLESKMADLQREIEEMLLPENDASLASDITPKELTDMQTSLDEQPDEILENITPSLASPEPEDSSETQIPQKATENEEKSVLDIKTIPDSKIDPENLKQDIQVNKSEPSNITSLILVETPEQILNKGHVEGVNSTITNTSFTPSTNNLIDIQQDNFWKEKALVDDAEKLLVEQILPKLDNFASSPLKSDTNREYTIESKQTLPNDSDILSNGFIEAPFWPEKHLYHDAECEYFLQMAKKHKHQININTEVKNTDKKDKDKDPSGGSGHSSESEQPRESSGSPFDSNYLSMDLPGGICSWKDHSSYLSLETPSDSLTGLISEDTSKLVSDIPEDKLTTLSLAPVALLPPEQESPPQEHENRTTAKDNLSNNLETLLEEVRIVQSQLSDLPNETLDAMEAGLKEGIAVLVKCEEAAVLLEQKIMEYGHESEVQTLLKELIIMKARISKLLEQARQGLHTIKDAKIDMENQSKQIEEQKEQIAKLDNWLDAINTELKVSTKQTEVLTEEDIIRYIEIYERYIRQYEEYEIILRSITVISVDESSQSMQIKLNALKKTLEESRVLVIAEIERLRQILINIKYTADVEEEVSQTDRTIDSTSMPEEVVSQKIIETVEVVPSVAVKTVPEDDTQFEYEKEGETVEEIKSPKIVESKITTTIETQTGKSLISEAPSLHDKSVICQPEIIETQDVSITCAPPQEVEVQTSEQKSVDGEVLENIQVKQTTSDGHETIIISSRPVVREKAIDETSLLVDADYEGDYQNKNTELNITHSLPQSFETVMVEPDETTTEVVVDADGTKRIIVRKVRKTLVTRQQILHTQERSSHVLDPDGHRDHTYQQITLKQDQGSTQTFDDGGIQNVQYQTYDGQVITGLPGREMTIQEFTSKPEMIISMGQDMNPDQILQIAEGNIQPEIQTSSSSVTAVVEQVTKRIIKTRRRIIRRIVIIDGKEHVSEEIIEEPDDVEVSEEQIPRVSININDRNVPIDRDDKDDDDNKPPPDDRDTNQEDKKVSNIPEDKNKQVDKQEDSNEDAVKKSRDLKEDKDDAISEHDSNVQEHELRSSQLLLSGNEVTQLETSSSHFATLTQKVTRTVTRTRKRIIKHIQIIDGKEHVTEEVIEEPADVEIVELEPEETRVSLDEGTKMKRIKIVRQVQIIDGKEHVTEKVIEEDDDDAYEPEIIAASDVEPSYPQEYIVTETEQPQFTTADNKWDNVADLTSNLIASEINHSLISEQKGEREVVKETVDDKKKDLPRTKELTDTNESTTKPEVIEEVDKNLQKVTLPYSPTEITQKESYEPDHSVVKDALLKTVEVTSSDNNTHGTILKEQTEVTMISQMPTITYDIDSQTKIDTHDFPKESAIREHVSDVSIPEEIVVSLGHNIGENMIRTSSTVTEGFTTVTNRYVTRIRKRIIRHIQVIDGNEHVTEEVVEEPEEVIAEPSTYTIQEEGVKTRRIRIIRNVQIIDGKEHVTEQIVEDSDDEYIPDSTVTANIDVKIGPCEKLTETETVEIKEPVKEILQEKHKPQEISPLEISKGFIDREKEHTVSTITSTTVTKEDITDTTTKPESVSENKIPEIKEIVSPAPTDSDTAISTIVQEKISVDVPDSPSKIDLCVTDILSSSNIKLDSVVKTEEDVSSEIKSVPQVVTKTCDSEIDIIPQLSEAEIPTAVPATIPERQLSEAEIPTAVPATITERQLSQAEILTAVPATIPERQLSEAEIPTAVPATLPERQLSEAEIPTAVPVTLPEQTKSIKTTETEFLIEDNQLQITNKDTIDETQKQSLTDITKCLIDSESSHFIVVSSPESTRIDKDLPADSVKVTPEVEVVIPGEIVSTTEASVIDVTVEGVEKSPLKEKESIVETSEPENEPINNENITTDAQSDLKNTSILDATKSFLGTESEHSSIGLKVTKIQSEPEKLTSILDDVNTDKMTIQEKVTVTPTDIQSDDNKSMTIAKGEIRERDVEEMLSPDDQKESEEVDLPRQDVAHTLQDTNILISKTDDRVTIVTSEGLISPKADVEVFSKDLDRKIPLQVPSNDKDIPIVLDEDENNLIIDNKYLETIQKDSQFVGCQMQEQYGDIKCIKIVKQKVLIGDQEHTTEEIVEVPTDGSLPKSHFTTQIDLSISKTSLQEKEPIKASDIYAKPVETTKEKLGFENTIDFITSEAAHTSQLLKSLKDLSEKPQSDEKPEGVHSLLESVDIVPEQPQIEESQSKDITTPTVKYENEPSIVSESDSVAVPTVQSELQKVVNIDGSTQDETHMLSLVTVDAGSTQRTVDVTPIHTESPITEADIAVQPATSEVSYITQFEPQQTARDEPSEITVTTTPATDSKAEITRFIDLERHDTHLRDMKLTGPENKAIQADIPKDDTRLSTAQTVDVFMSIEKTDNINKTAPSVQLDLKVENLDQGVSSIVKKDVDVILPADITITKEPAKPFVETEPVPETLTQHPKTSETPKEKDKVKKKPKKNKQKRPSECSDSIEIELHTETDRTINDTESSSLGHYVELPVSPHLDSPKPTENVIQTSITQQADFESSPVSAVSVPEDKGYEPEDISLCPTPSPDKRKRGKRRKPKVTSELTTYPKQQTTEDATLVSSSIDTDEDLGRLKDTEIQEKVRKEDTNLEEPNGYLLPKPELSEIISSETISNSPKEESCHTISDASDVSTVKIVEECVTGSPEIVHDKISTTVTYPVPVVEEILTQEYSVQTSPETVPELEMVETEKAVLPPPETADTNLQTSPTPVDEVFVQTLPKEDKEVHTQTISIETLEVQDSEIQTSRINTPEVKAQSEVTTQVIPHDVSYLEEKNLQTSPIPELQENVDVSEVSPIDVESIEIQTSPWPQIQKDEKGTEVTIETADTNVQTLQHGIVDQETSTSPEKMADLIESSVQTSDVITISKFTQSDEVSSVEQDIPDVTLDKEFTRLPVDHKEQKTTTLDYSQQTSPTLMETLSHQSLIPIENIEKVDNGQQTSPRVTVEQATYISDKIDKFTSDKIQQTTPRDYPEDVIADIKKDVCTTDRVQQTSPRVYSDDSISTSTDEPYEIHLRAQISIPQATDDFINNERQIQEAPQSISGDKSKPKKRRHRKKTDTPLHSPGSLSDPINAELSISVTPTSEDLSSRETTSIDEGISQITSPVAPQAQQFVAQPKLTYSDVVQRSKSKSPSPTKTILPLIKSEKARLINSVEKRTQSMAEPQKNVSEDSLTIALIEPSMETSYDLIINKELNDLKTAIELRDNTKTEKSVLIVIETISIWLEEIQYKIQIESVTQTKVSDKSERLKELQNHVDSLKEILYITEVNEEVITLIETLTRQVEAVKQLSSNSSVKVKEVENEWGKFLEDTEMLSLSIERVKMRLDDMIILELSVQQKLDELDSVELENVDNTDTVRKLFRRFRSIVEVNPKRECPLKLYTCDEDTKQIENSINTERDRLMQLMTLAEEYEQTLQDFGHITDVAEALLDGKIIVSDLEHLHEEIQKHRKFFVNLSHCRAILESLEDNLDNETRAKFSSLHNSLHDRATKIIDRAAGRAQQMTLAASRWSVLDHGMKDEQQWLRVAHQRIPDLTNVTSMDHEQYINLYQSISLDVSHHYAKMLRLLSITESLQNLIVCSGLETECSIALNTLLTLQDGIDSRLTRLRAFKENWMTYEHLINRVESWMVLATRELENITPDNITTTANLRRFWELKAQHEVHLSLKNESGVQFEKALEILPISDEMVQRQFFMKIEDKWRELASSIGDLHATAIQNISDPRWRCTV
ncbi:PREDICTED: uncharacterized protein LOC106111484 [Papilio polytes]|uniref:uncharacterized protein LOC106111484 n=1 Tax=Papilio polytes TaxID=76194 RepID=UPI00067670F8|nr:PREDICTED: uncharacterized protein LOC106111484 [Papilio polytes]